jgi:hypothetical protein
MHIGKSMIRPWLWRAVVAMVGLTFVGIAALVAEDPTTDTPSTAGAVVFMLGFGTWAVLGLRIGVVKSSSGIVVRSIGKSHPIDGPAHVKVEENMTWWGATYLAPVVVSHDPNDPTKVEETELTWLALYAFTQRGKRRAEKLASVLDDWMSAPSRR